MKTISAIAKKKKKEKNKKEGGCANLGESVTL